MVTATYEGFFHVWQGMLATITAGGYFRDLTPAWERTLGWSLDELRARPFIDFVHEEDREATLAEVAQLFQGRGSMRFENRCLCKDGSYKWLLWTSFVDTSKPPEERLIHSTIAEITDHVETRRRLEHGLAEARRELERVIAEAQSFRSLLDATSDFVSTADLTGMLTYLNPAGRRMVGREDEDPCGKPIPMFHTPSYAEHLQRVGISHAHTHGIWSGEGELVRRDGTVIPISQIIVPLRDTSGQIFASGTMIRDITRSKALESELRDRTNRLSAALEAMSTPLIPITREIVVMPLIGHMDSERAARVMDASLAGVQASGAQVVILDVTGLAVVDSQVAAALVRAARALRLLGARTVLTGIQPAVAQTLVSLGLDLEGITTHGTLQSAIAAALRGEAPSAAPPRRR
ncbi:MAG: PAS domain S-box protein [Polyangiaceae bacterium]|nr:PAS domain S-box protein [Polyangiaceae bacterium]